MMINTKKLMQRSKSIWIIALCYISIIGFIIPFMIIALNWYQVMYDIFERMATVGVFFTLYLISTLLFFPFIYSTLLQEKRSYEGKKSKKRIKQPRLYGYLLFIISIPLVIWLIVGNI